MILHRTKKLASALQNCVFKDASWWYLPSLHMGPLDELRVNRIIKAIRCLLHYSLVIGAKIMNYDGMIELKPDW